VKDFDVDMTLGNNGITLTVYDNDGKLQGKLRLGLVEVRFLISNEPRWGECLGERTRYIQAPG
jgi:hypothetical protein